MRYLDRNLGLLNIVLGVAFFVSTLTSFTAEASAQAGLMTNGYFAGRQIEVLETLIPEERQASFN